MIVSVRAICCRILPQTPFAQAFVVVFDLFHLTGRVRQAALANSNMKLRRLDLASELIGTIGFSWTLAAFGTIRTLLGFVAVTSIALPFQLMTIRQVIPSSHMIRPSAGTQCLTSFCKFASAAFHLHSVEEGLTCDTWVFDTINISVVYIENQSAIHPTASPDGHSTPNGCPSKGKHPKCAAVTLIHGSVMKAC